MFRGMQTGIDGEKEPRGFNHKWILIVKTRSLVAHLDVLTDGTGKPDRPHLHAALCAVITV